MKWQQVRIGTRGSKLALIQAEWARATIAPALGGNERANLVVIRTSGDATQDRRLSEIGGKGLFTRELETALLDGRIDCAVHSLKDMPAVGADGLVIGAVAQREDPRDAFVSARFDSLAALPPGARLGTASQRRAAQALHVRPDLEIVILRGNVDTRLAKLDAGEMDAIVLALAGLKRLGLAGRARALIDPVEAPPAPGQGALAVQVRATDGGAEWLEALRDARTTREVAAERGAMTVLEGSCRTAIGAYARTEDGRLVLTVEALTPDGARRFRRSGDIAGDADETEARALGLRLGAAVAADGGEAIVG